MAVKRVPGQEGDPVLDAIRRAPLVESTLGDRAAFEAGVADILDQGLPVELGARLDELDRKREDETLTPDEHAELLRLTSSLEDLEAKRVEHLSRLADLRGLSLRALMDTLGIPGPLHG